MNHTPPFPCAHMHAILFRIPAIFQFSLGHFLSFFFYSKSGSKLHFVTRPIRIVRPITVGIYKANKVSSSTVLRMTQFCETDKAIKRAFKFAVFHLIASKISPHQQNAPASTRSMVFESISSRPFISIDQFRFNKAFKKVDLMVKSALMALQRRQSPKWHS